MATIAQFRPPYPLDIAASLAEVEWRLESFLAGSDGRGLELAANLSRFSTAFRAVAIVGGMIRDFARVGAPGFHSDIDLVIDAPTAAVSDFARQVGARANAFGGNSVVLGGWEFDFWALETTWAAREGHVHLSVIDDVLKSTFFEIDAILFHLGRRKVICNDVYLSSQQLNILEVNLEANASIIGCLYRAARRILGWELTAGSRLRHFISNNLDSAAFVEMTSIEKRKMATPIIQSFQDVTALREALAIDS
ncbi:hypothetical protein G6L37_06770 [Agrobacterium rubi]|nr:hypothetical protein [Agrobacterium rubi]NTF25067.1 hypothetical protein [Agrobacterium rubi]